VGLIASKRSVGGAVQRNRARRRLREIVRRRWPRIASTGFGLVLIALRGAVDAPHAALAAEIERLLAQAGAMSPAGEDGRR
jgi:ribonuclease P protein component